MPSTRNKCNAWCYNGVLDNMLGARGSVRVTEGHYHVDDCSFIAHAVYPSPIKSKAHVRVAIRTKCLLPLYTGIKQIIC